MTRSIGRQLTPAILALLDGSTLESKIGAAIQCLTMTETGWPYLALVSVGELLAVSSSKLRLAIWSTSTTTRNLERERRCALALVVGSVSYLIRCETSLVGSFDQLDGPTLSVFALDVVDVLEDVAPYATLTSGVTFELHEPTEVLERWRRTIARLRVLDRGV